MNNALITIENGNTRHPDWRMAKPVNLQILEGEQIAICGDNASGKSRLIEILTGHYPLQGTEVKYNFETKTRAVDAVTGVKRLVSEQLKYITFRDSYGDQDGTYYYQQRWNQHDIDENTPTVGELLDKIPEFIPGLRQQLYKMFQLEHTLDKYIISLSSGELRKFQLTKVLLTGPRVLILDNPFIGLDAQTRDLLKELLSTIVSQTSIHFILVLSNPNDIPDFITHVIEVRDLEVLPKTDSKSYCQQLGKDDSDAKLHTTENHIDTGTEEILHFYDVSIRYGSRTILKDLNWTVRKGERWALSGENGAGKSTLLSLVCADNPQAYACKIDLFGKRRGTGESIWEIKKHIGYVSPEMHRAYLKDLPAIDIVASGLTDSVGLYCRPKPEQKAICLEWMERFDIQHLADRTFLKLSSGEQRLCLLARAFVKSPELLILDEPMHGLDMKNRQMVKDIINEYCQDSQKTMIMVTHYVEELPDCITDSIFLKKNI